MVLFYNLELWLSSPLLGPQQLALMQQVSDLATVVHADVRQ